MTDVTAHTETKMGSERHFGVVFGTVFLLVGLVSIFYGGSHWRYLLPIAAACYALALLAPSTLRAPNRLWFSFGLFLHAVFSPIVMFLIYLVTLVPAGLIFRLRGKDLLARDFDATTNSYWIERKQPPGTMTRQF